jgi:TonB family protein
MLERTTPQARRIQVDAPGERPRRPVGAAVRPKAPAKTANRANSFGLIAASVALVAVIGAAADYFFVNQEQVSTRAEQPAAPPATDQPPATELVAEVTKPADDAVAPKEVAAEVPAPAPVKTTAAAPAPKDPAPAKPKPAAPAKPPVRAAAKPAAKPAPKAPTAPREVPAPAPLSAAVTAPASAPPAREGAPAPAPERATPVGPIFETKDVNEQPKVAARVEPRLPAELKARKVHEIVIVRALVSQSGHPSRVSVLRKSKAGPDLDNVVVAAVNQWTFSPARKKGEPVSCWFNFGVQVGNAD